MISLHQLTKSYETPAGPFTAVHDVNLEIGAGEFVAIVGKSGSGKSTLLNLIGGIDRPSSGSVELNGTAIQSMPENRLAAWRGRAVGFVFQFFQLLPTLTVAENVMLPMDFCRVLPPAGARARSNCCRSAWCADQADKLPSALSGRPAAARRDRPRAGERSARPARRRTDRQSRLADRRGYLPALRENGGRGRPS